MDAWFPILHLEKGLRGDLNVKIQINLIKDENENNFKETMEV